MNYPFVHSDFTLNKNFLLLIMVEVGLGGRGWGGKAPPNVYVKLETEITVIIVWRVYFIKKFSFPKRQDFFGVS